MEAEKDIENGCYNKAVSALYFSLRMVSEDLLLALHAPIPKRDDKLANSIGNIGFKKVSQALRRLYDLRKKADYSREKVTAREAIVALETYREARRRLEEGKPEACKGK